MKKRNVRAPSQRQLRVGEQVRHALCQILERGEVHDPELVDKIITVTEVRLSPDLKNATAFVVPLGGRGDAIEIASALNRIKPFLRHRVSQSVHLRSAPNLSFLADKTFDEAGHINELLHLPEVARDLKRPDPEGNDDDGA